MVAMLAVTAVPAFAQDGAAPANSGAVTIAMWSIITAGFALGIAAFGGALGQGKAVAAAAEGIARNPSASGEIRGALILGLVLIESLVIYAFVVSLILLFIKPFAA
jgi:F-type H+-transporting ATPase subunit c